MAEVFLERGSQDTQAVLELQQLLNQAGAYPVLPVNGQFDAATEIAVRHFQWVHELHPHGIVDQSTWAVLVARPKSLPLAPQQRPVLNYKASGGPVYEVQARLNMAGAQPPIEITGEFDGKTLKAVQQFQWRSNLTVHGTVDAATWSHLLGWVEETNLTIVTPATPPAIASQMPIEPAIETPIDHNNLSLQMIAQMEPEDWEKLQSRFPSAPSSPSTPNLSPSSPPLANPIQLNFPHWKGPRTPKGRPYLMAEFREPPNSIEGPIHEVQRLLQANGYKHVPHNGYFNRAVVEAVKAFQTQYHLIAIDGRVGDEVWDRLLNNISDKPSKPSSFNTSQTTPSLAYLCNYYDPKNSPHQTAALLWLQSQVPIETYNAFVAYWRNPN